MKTLGFLMLIAPFLALICYAVVMAFITQGWRGLLGLSLTFFLLGWIFTSVSLIVDGHPRFWKLFY